MNTISRFFEMQELGYVNIRYYTPFLILVLVIGVTFGFAALAVILEGTENTESSRLCLGMFAFSGISLVVMYFMITSMMNLEIQTVENNLNVLEEVNNRIEQDYKIIMNGEDGPIMLVDYSCTYNMISKYKFIIDDTNKIIEMKID